MSEDTISRKATIDAMENVDWYHINKDGQLTHGANSKEDEPLYKAEDVYKVLNDVSSAQPVAKDINVPINDCISRQAAIDSICRTVCDNPEICVSPCDEVKILRNMPSAQPETHEERTETHACDLISRQAAVECDGFREVERDDERRSN